MTVKHSESWLLQIVNINKWFMLERQSCRGLCRCFTDNYHRKTTSCGHFRGNRKLLPKPTNNYFVLQNYKDRHKRAIDKLQKTQEKKRK